MSARPGEAVLWDALRGGLVTRALGLVADLGVARVLCGGPRRVEGLAEETGADPDVLHRLLRALASDGIFTEVSPGVFANTPASTVLAQDGWEGFAHLFGGDWLRAVAALDASGAPSFPRVFGTDLWSWLAGHPRERTAFDRAMAQGWRSRLERLDALAWRGDETVVDVGGGDGSLMRALLERRPGLRAVVLDLPETVRDEAAFGERCTFVAGSFFDAVPAGDVFVLATILHDWDDAAALRILRAVRAAAADGARLVLLEDVIEPGDEPSGGKWLDLLMLTLAGGRERTEAQWRELLAAGGFEPVRVRPGVVEARPAARP